MTTSAKELAERLRQPWFGPVTQAQLWIETGTFVLDLDPPVTPRSVTAERAISHLQRAIVRLQWAIESVKDWADESTEAESP